MNAKTAYFFGLSPLPPLQLIRQFSVKRKVSSSQETVLGLFWMTKVLMLFLWYNNTIIVTLG